MPRLPQPCSREPLLLHRAALMCACDLPPRCRDACCSAVQMTCCVGRLHGCPICDTKPASMSLTRTVSHNSTVLRPCTASRSSVCKYASHYQAYTLTIQPSMLCMSCLGDNFMSADNSSKNHGSISADSIVMLTCYSALLWVHTVQLLCG